MGYGWQIGRLNFWFLPHWSGVCEHISTQWTIVFLLDYSSACNVCRFSTNASTFLQIFTHGGRQWRQPQHKTIFLRLVRLIQCQVFTFHLLTFHLRFGFHSCGFGCIALLDFNNDDYPWFDISSSVCVLLVSPNLFLGGNKQYRVGVCLFTVFCDRMENNL